MASSVGSCCCSYASQILPRSKFPALPFPSSSSAGFTVTGCKTPCLASAKKNDSDAIPVQSKKSTRPNSRKEAEEEEEVEEELPWIQEKPLDLVEFTGSVTHAIPGPRVGRSSFPWILAVPLAYAGLTFVIAFVKTVRKFSSLREKRRRLVNKNAVLCKSIDELLKKGRDELKPDALQRAEGFSMEEILRKYIRYALNEKPFNPDMVTNLIQLRKASILDDARVAEILNDISSELSGIKASPVVMDTSGYSEKGFKRKLAVQALFGEVYYLSELPEFCSPDSSLVVKEIFGVTDGDSEKLRIHKL